MGEGFLFVTVVGVVVGRGVCLLGGGCWTVEWFFSGFAPVWVFWVCL